MTEILATAFNYFFQLLEMLIFIRVLLSWIPLPQNHSIKIWIYKLTEPILGPARTMLNRSIFGGNAMRVDFSPIIAILVLDLLQKMITSMLLG